MPNPRTLCVLIAEVQGGDRLIERLGEAETTQAVERCLNRIDLAIGGSGGEIIVRTGARVIAAFKQCDGATLAACEAVDRVGKLPPVSGSQMRVRIGIHYGEVNDTGGDAVEGARKILLSCADDQIFASEAAFDQLSPSVRYLVDQQPCVSDAQLLLPWPVYAIGSSLPHRSATAQPSTQPTPRPAAPRPIADTPVPAPRVSRPSQPPLDLSYTRLHISHQQATMFVEERRPVILIGRELGNDIVIGDPRASRQHARIERRPNGFVLIDQSTNGCYLTVDGHEERLLKTGEVILPGAGRFGCGFSTKDAEEDVIRFTFV